MIQFEKFVLDNGLKVIFHKDESTPMAVVNVLYDVGAKDEHIEQTGFAHLFEHLMFGGSINIPSYDEPLQVAGGENNAYTTNDITNYYLKLPKENLETGFWLESDRMLSLAFDENSLEVQRKVVCEEFKENYINKPYGDVWKYLRELCYKQHPYQWMTIGKELAHIEDAQLQDVKNFFKKHYNPQNAILAVAGNATLEEVKRLAKKYFEPIHSGEKYERNIAEEPTQKETRRLTVEKDVPVSLIMKAYHIEDRQNPHYYTADIITEVLAGGKSARLYTELVKDKKLFSQVNCYHTGSVEKGLLVVMGNLADGITPEDGEKAIDSVVQDFISEGVSQDELDKVINKIESLMEFEDMSLISRANNLAFYELLGDASKMNEEFENYKSVSAAAIREQAAHIFRKENENVLFYLAK
jgi:predicted Zn-dependent peptidase